MPRNPKVPPLKIKIHKNTIEDDEGFRSPRTPKNPKNPTGSVSQIFISPNRYTPLTQVSPSENNDIVDSTPINQEPPNDIKPPPPIYIKDEGLDFKLLKSKLIELVGDQGFFLKTFQKNIKLQANSTDNYRSIIHLLNEEPNAQFHTYQLQNEKPYRVVIRNLHPSTSCEEIKSALENFNFSVIQVTNVLQRQTKTPLPLFFVDLEKDDNCQSIFDITAILHTKIKIEEPHKRREIIQCQNCQDYGHTRTYCGYSPRCVRCGENHLSALCSKPKDLPATCALCNGNHPANYRGCQIHKDLQRLRLPLAKKPPTM